MPNTFKLYKMYSSNEYNVRAFVSQRTVFGDSVEPAALIVKDGKIVEIIKNGKGELDSMLQNSYGIAIEDFVIYC